MSAFPYTSRDYSSLREQLTTAVRRRVPGWNPDDDPNDFGVVLIEAMALMGDTMSYYIDRSAQEMSILTASVPANVYALANLYGYTPDLAVSAVARVVLGNPTEVAITVPAKTLMATSQGLLFESTTDVTVPGRTQEEGAGPVPGTAEVPVWQGTSTSVGLGASSGKAGQTFPINSATVDARADGLWVDVKTGATTARWRYTDHILDEAPSALVFTLRPTPSGNYIVCFGDGIAGRVPPAGATLVLNYRECAGAKGNVLAKAINQLAISTDNPAYAGLSRLTAENPNAAQQGVDAESLESIRRNGVAALRSQRRAITAADYADIARTVQGVHSALCTGRMWSRPVVYILPSSYATATNTEARDELITRVNETLARVCPVGVSPTSVMAATTAFNTVVQLTLAPDSSRAVVYDAARTALMKRYGYATLGFSGVRASDIVTTLTKSVPGLTNVQVLRLWRAGSSTAGAADLVPAPGETFRISLVENPAHADYSIKLVGGTD